MTVSATALAARVARTISGQRLFSPGDTIIVALSGGADSTALLDLLAGLTPCAPRLVAAHLNHCLRGPESDADEEFVRSLAARYDIPFVSRRVDVKELVRTERLNLEDAGRRARIAFLEEVRQEWRATAIALAHHADDQAETVLMRLLRGAGSRGLSGMPFRNGRGWIRPLLDVTRSEIEAYLIGRGLSWRDDASNRDTDFLRNRIRHELLPLLEQYNQAVRERLATTAALLADEDALLDQQAADAVAKVCRAEQDRVVCDIPQLVKLPLPLQRRVVRRVLEQLLGALAHYSRRHIEAIEHLITSARPNATLKLPQRVTALREYGTLLITRNGPTEAGTDETLTIRGVGSYTLPDGATLVLEHAVPPAGFGSVTPDTAFFDLDRTPFPWQVRTFRNGDRIAPYGMVGSKKVKDLFIDEKVPRTLRRRIPLVFCGDILIWVCGLRTSSRAVLDGTSSRLVKAVLSATWDNSGG